MDTVTFKAKYAAFKDVDDNVIQESIDEANATPHNVPLDNTMRDTILGWYIGHLLTLKGEPEATAILANPDCNVIVKSTKVGDLSTTFHVDTAPLRVASDGSNTNRYYREYTRLDRLYRYSNPVNYEVWI